MKLHEKKYKIFEIVRIFSIWYNFYEVLKKFKMNICAF